MKKFQTKRMLLTLSLILATSSFAHAQLTVAGFTNYDLQGFNVLVNSQMLVDHPTVTEDAINYLDTLLLRIGNLGLMPDIMDSLHAVPIFMEWAVAGASAWYHPDVNWLIQNGYNPAKAKAVEIANLNYFVQWSRQNQPWLMMHELSHAYHDRVLSYTYAPIIDAYHAAITAGIYNSVPYNPGNGNPPFNQAAYAKTNSQEYFAEITEAYLGENDYFPFDSADLKTHDPAGYELVRSIWRLGGTTAIDPGGSRSAFSLYPNPARALLQLRLPENLPPYQLTIFANNGAVVRPSEGIPASNSLNISQLPAGLYRIRIIDSGGDVHTATFMKQ